MLRKVWLNKKKLTLKKIFSSAFWLRQLKKKVLVDKVYSGIYSNMWDSATIEQYEDGKLGTLVNIEKTG